MLDNSGKKQPQNNITFEISLLGMLFRFGNATLTQCYSGWEMQPQNIITFKKKLAL